jgi:beta-mannosidase
MHGATNVPVSVPQDAGRYLEVPVPMELHKAMQHLGLTGDSNVGINSLAGRWIEEQYWQYHRTFTCPAEAAGRRAWLVFDRLDLAAHVYLNGVQIAEHCNAFRPCRIDVSGRLKEGPNSLIVIVESGLYLVSEKEGAAYLKDVAGRLNKRHWLRKPQYQFGWDWNPRLINVGITGGVRLEFADSARMDQVALWTTLSDDYSQGRVVARVFVEGPSSTEATPIKIRMRIPNLQLSGEVEAEAHPGSHAYEIALDVPKPKLWWPRGLGEQPLYTVDVEAATPDGAVFGRKRLSTGFRTVRIDRSPHPKGGEHFILCINGHPVFLKGGNWVPPDMIQSAVDAGRIRKLVQEAVSANFNTLRIWGGGEYARADLLNACDRAGILIWHDFPFACSRYPADDEHWLEEVRQEVRWAVRELAPHPSLVLWCGNNEIETGYYSWGYDRAGKATPDHALYHMHIPRIVKEEDPSGRPYWPSSPYSGPAQDPDDPTVGDQHPWSVSLGAHGADFWYYRRMVDRCANEGGVLGASPRATLEQFMSKSRCAIRSFSWEHHDNNMQFREAELGVAYQAVQRWLGRPYTDFSFNDYIFASALLQAEGLMEYIMNYRRRKFGSSAAVFWMYNDSWPATHGWSVVDYYGRRKLAWYAVRRAFSPLAVAAVDHGSQITVFGISDLPEEWRGQVRYGLFGLRGGMPLDESIDVVLPPNAAQAIATIDKKTWEARGTRSHGAFAMLLQEGAVIHQHRTFIERFKRLEFGRPAIEARRDGGDAVLKSEVYIWGACTDLNGEVKAADNCFDLLPGVEYRFPAAEGERLHVLRTGNDLLLEN